MKLRLDFANTTCLRAGMPPPGAFPPVPPPGSMPPSMPPSMSIPPVAVTAGPQGGGGPPPGPPPFPPASMHPGKAAFLLLC